MMLAGDKESFWMAFELAGVPYRFSDGYSSSIGHTTVDHETGEVKLCSTHALHLGWDGKPLWYNGSLYRNKHAHKGHKEWLSPTVWAEDTGKWLDAECMLNVNKSNGLHHLTDSKMHQIHQSLQQKAMQINAAYDHILN